MKTKFAFQRTCAVCKAKKHKSEMLRIVKNPHGEISCDIHQNQDGRGAYICKTQECINKCVTKKLINKSFKTQVDSKVYEDITRILS
ncbi:MAG: YlxR family protein [Firmicutes bacterium]|nr:YlxR family protein [Bacillota bacterium]